MSGLEFKESNAFQDSVRLLESIKNECLSSLVLSNALDLAELYGHIAFRNHCGVYSAEDIESGFCRFFSSLLPALNLFKNKASNDSCVFIMTEAYLSGGHTRLVERYASFHDKKPDIVITGNISKKIVNRLLVFFENVHVLKGKSKEDKVVGLASMLSSYQKVFLAIHPHDILPVVSLRLTRMISQQVIYFINHADHGFSYGFSIVDISINISSFSNRLNARARKSGFVGIPIEPFLSAKKVGLEGVKSIVTAAHGLKFKPMSGLSVFSTVDLVLNNVPNLRFTVVGPRLLTDYWWWALKIKYPSRIIFYDSLPFDSYIKFVFGEGVVFLDSYPMTGGTAFPELIASGGIGFKLNGPIIGYSECDALTLSKADILKFLLNEDFRRDFISLTDKIRMSVLEGQSLLSVKGRYLQIVNEGICVDAIGSKAERGLEFFERNTKERLWADIVFPSASLKLLSILFVNLGFVKWPSIVFCFLKSLIRLCFKWIRR